MKWRALLIVVHGLFFLAACSTVPTLAPEALRSLSQGDTARYFYPSAGGHAEAYLVRPRGRGPSPLIVLLHGHRWSGVGTEGVLLEAALLARTVRC